LGLRLGGTTSRSAGCWSLRKI